MPRNKSSYALADGDMHEPKLKKRSKKQKERALLRLSNTAELAHVSLSSRSERWLKEMHNPLINRNAIAVYGTRTDKKVTDPRRRNKKKQLKARQFDRLCKLDEQMDELYALRYYHPSSYCYSDVMCREDDVPEEAACGKVECVEVLVEEKSAKTEKDDALNEVAAEKPLFRLRRSRSLVVSKVPTSPLVTAEGKDDTDEREERSDTSSLYKMSEVSSEEGWTMA